MTGLWSWLARRLDPELLADRDSLAEQVDQLAYERDEWMEWAEHVEGEARAREGALLKEIRRLLEPVQVGTCEKVRYLHQKDADEHAAHLACRYPGDAVNVYRCRACRPYPAPWKTVPWHVGRCRMSDSGAFWVDDEGLHRPGWPVVPPIAKPALYPRESS